MTETGRLSVTGPFETTDLRVLDANMQEVSAGTHALTADLSPGIYRVIAQVPGARAEKLVLVEPGRPTDVGDFVLEWDSIAPHAESHSQHEYQTEPAKQHSMETHISVGTNPQARLFVFVRTTGDPRPEAPAFRLTRGDGEVLASFPEVGALQLSSGWGALSMQLPGGTYQLEHDAPTLGRRAQAVFVEDGWQTQLFVPWREAADLGGAVTFMKRPSEGFNPDHWWEYTRIEAAMQGLVNGKMIMHPAEAPSFLEGKFDNPMLGLIGAYALLLAEDVNFDLLTGVADTLLHLVPHSPDARLLAFLAQARGAMPPPAPPTGWPLFQEPPLFTSGTQRLLNIASHVREVCPADSWLGRISMTLVTDGPWTRWEPGLQTPEAVTKLKQQLDVLLKDSERRVGDFIDRLAESLSLGTLRIIKKDQIAPVLKALLNQGAPQLGRALQDAGVLKVDKLSSYYAEHIAPKLAPELQLPVSVVAEALRKLLEERRADASTSIAPHTEGKALSRLATSSGAARTTGTGSKSPPARALPSIVSPAPRKSAGSRSATPKTPAGRRGARPKRRPAKRRRPGRP